VCNASLASGDGHSPGRLLAGHPALRASDFAGLCFGQAFRRDGIIRSPGTRAEAHGDGNLPFSINSPKVGEWASCGLAFFVAASVNAFSIFSLLFLSDLRKSFPTSRP
jgi:hypothetical protein